MTIIEAIRAWLANCPLLAGGKINVDFLDAEATGYSVDTTPCDPIVQEYLDGSSVRRFEFTVATRAYYDADLRQQIDNIAFFDQLAEWMEDQAENGSFPELGDGRSATELKVTTSGYCLSADTEFARYQMQCRLIYDQE